MLYSTEVKNSNAIELESLKRHMKYLEDVCVTKLVTDCHIQVSAYMANEKPNVEHSYDVWHVSKGIIVYTVYCFHHNIHIYLVITPKILM